MTEKEIEFDSIEKGMNCIARLIDIYSNVIDGLAQAITYLSVLFFFALVPIISPLIDVFPTDQESEIPLPIVIIFIIITLLGIAKFIANIKSGISKSIVNLNKAEIGFVGLREMIKNDTISSFISSLFFFSAGILVRIFLQHAFAYILLILSLWFLSNIISSVLVGFWVNYKTGKFADLKKLRQQGFSGFINALAVIGLASLYRDTPNIRGFHETKYAFFAGIIEIIQNILNSYVSRSIPLDLDIKKLSEDIATILITTNDDEIHSITSLLIRLTKGLINPRDFLVELNGVLTRNYVYIGYSRYLDPIEKQKRLLKKIYGLLNIVGTFFMLFGITISSLIRVVMKTIFVPAFIIFFFAELLRRVGEYKIDKWAGIIFGKDFAVISLYCTAKALGYTNQKQTHQAQQSTPQT